MRIGVLCLTDDPFDPPGHGRHGGSNKVMFDMGRHFVRRGATITYVCRLNSVDKPTFEQFGARCSIHRIPIGPPERMPYYECAGLLDEMTEAVRGIADLNAPTIERVVSYNWLSGEVAVRLYSPSVIHTHYVLTLGRAKRVGGEPKAKISDFWLECEDRTFAHARYIVTCSTRERQELLRFYPVDPEKIFCIPPGVDLNVFGRRPGAADHLVRRAANRFGEGSGDPR
jgi:glycosyltransferase involved in cell wall biosynthesis